MRNEKRRIKHGKHDVLSEKLKKDSKPSSCYKVIQKNMKDSNDYLYAVVTPVNKMD
ncbi:hypothetical protein [Pseudalkalibacillus decolorationis]|uniref:hypothetical protein n=1 Tax=Pseudalkalibacillus decolorationis TaxID=163879 RepID=UPI0021481634|nr:hypothetical protein [Pseudalkalibacillus decolorationis]